MNLLIALIPAVIWGINPTFIGKIGGKPVQQATGFSFGALIMAVVLFLVLRPEMSTGMIIAGLISGLGVAVGVLSQFKSYEILGTSMGFALTTGFILVFNALFGVLVFHEWTTALQLGLGFGALLLILFGVSRVAYREKKEQVDLKSGLIVSLISGIGFMLYSCAPQLGSAGGFGVLLPQAIGFTAGVLLIGSFGSKGVKRFDGTTLRLIMPGLLWALANLALIFSNEKNGVAVGFTVGNFCLVISTIMSLTVLHEASLLTKKEMRYTAYGVILITIGMVMIGMTKVIA